MLDMLYHPYNINRVRYPISVKAAIVRSFIFFRVAIACHSLRYALYYFQAFSHQISLEFRKDRNKLERNISVINRNAFLLNV